MKLVIPKGSTSRIVTVFIQANNVTTGAGLGSLTNASGIVGGYVREGGTGVALAVDEDVTTEGTYQAPSAAGKVRIGTPANMRTGTYELHFHNDLWATGAEAATITLGGAANMGDITLEVQLSDPVRGLGSPTALPNAAADAAGGLPISDAGGLDLDAKLANTNEVTAARMGALTDWINGGRLDLIIDGIDAKTTNLPSDPADQSLIISATNTILADTNAILVDTNEMQTDWANGGRLELRFDTLDASVADVPTNAELATAISSGLATYDGPTNTEMVAAFTEIKGATWATTDTLEAIRDRGDVAWITATSVTVSDKTGFSLANGSFVTATFGTCDFTSTMKASINTEVLDVVNVDTLIDGKTIVQSLIYIGAVVAGRVSGAGTGTEVFKGLDELTTRVTVTVDSSGNRSDIVYG